MRRRCRKSSTCSGVNDKLRACALLLELARTLSVDVLDGIGAGVRAVLVDDVVESRVSLVDAG